MLQLRAQETGGGWSYLALRTSRGFADRMHNQQVISVRPESAPSDFTQAGGSISSCVKKQTNKQTGTAVEIIPHVSEFKIRL